MASYGQLPMTESDPNFPEGRQGLDRARFLKKPGDIYTSMGFQNYSLGWHMLTCWEAPRPCFEVEPFQNLSESFSLKMPQKNTSAQAKSTRNQPYIL
jgi:hypothetical protein